MFRTRISLAAVLLIAACGLRAQKRAGGGTNYIRNTAGAKP